MKKLMTFLLLGAVAASAFAQCGCYADRNEIRALTTDPNIDFSRVNVVDAGTGALVEGYDPYRKVHWTQVTRGTVTYGSDSKGNKWTCNNTPYGTYCR